MVDSVNETHDKKTIMELIDNIDLTHDIFQFNPDLEGHIIGYVIHLQTGIKDFLKKYELDADKKHHYEFLISRLEEIKNLKNAAKTLWWY